MGLANISQILGRLKPRGEAASGTFQGAGHLNNGTRAAGGNQSSGRNIGLNTEAPTIRTDGVYGGGASQATPDLVDLSGANKAVDASAAGIGTTAAGGEQYRRHTVNLSDIATVFLTGTSQSFTSTEQRSAIRI